MILDTLTIIGCVKEKFLVLVLRKGLKIYLSDIWILLENVLLNLYYILYLMTITSLKRFLCIYLCVDSLKIEKNVVILKYLKVEWIKAA